jgi:D-alanyl-D-alanine carboxypeptidase (penicillin-binding protein 5/6)
MKEFCSLFLICAFISSLACEARPLKVEVEAEAAILINADSGAILYEKNAHTTHYPASITKIATAAYALKKKGGDLDEKITADREAVASVTGEAKRKANYRLAPHFLEDRGTHIGIQVGEQLTLRDLLYGMMLQSGNDAANVIAQYVGNGSIPGFMNQVNGYLKEIGCKNTQFLNPHGLYHPDHKTTAYDMAKLTSEAMKDPIFCKIVSSQRYLRPKTNKQEATPLVQSNKLLRSGPLYYAKAIGVKTGYTSHSLNTFVAAAKSGERTLIAVLLRVKERPDMFKDAVKLFEKAFSEQKMQKVLFQSGSQKVIRTIEGGDQPISTYLSHDIIVAFYPSEEPQFKAQVVWSPISLPVEKNSQVGELWITAQRENGKEDLLQKAPLFSLNSVQATWKHKMQLAIASIQQHTALLWAVGAIILIILGFIIYSKRKA